MDAIKPKTHTTPRLKGDPQLTAKLRALCVKDNRTNWFYIARAYLVIAASTTGVAFAHQASVAEGYGPWLAAPAYLLALFAIGASQHQLAGATHEATHHSLFKNRLLNELASDWLCMFPLYSTTYTFRLYHLMHHQYVNDPERDPDFVVLAKSGHWLGFPVAARRFTAMLLKQALLLPLVRYALVRFKYNALGAGMESSYQRKEKASKLPERIGFAWFAGLVALQVWLSYQGSVALAAGLSLAYWLVIGSIYASLAEHHFAAARLRPVVPRRYLAMSRSFFVTMLYTALTCAQIMSGGPVWWCYILFWVVPMLTTFPFFMILRQVVQHANGDRGWLTNTRTFLVHPLLRYAVFPFGMDYHLGHHMYATVPHYRLPELHTFLLRYPEYANEGLVVENYWWPERRDEPHPTVVEVLGPHYARQTADVYIDDTVLDDWEVDEKEEILRAGRRTAS